MLRVCSLNVFVFGIVFVFIFVFLYLYFHVLWSCNLSPHHSDEKSLKPLLECVLEKYVSLQCQGHVLSCSDSVKDPNDQMIQI